MEEVILGCKIEDWLKNKTLGDMDRWLKQKEGIQSDLGVFAIFGKEIGLPQVGRGPGKFLCSEGYDLPGGKNWYKRGFYDGGIHLQKTPRDNPDKRRRTYRSGKGNPGSLGEG